MRSSLVVLAMPAAGPVMAALRPAGPVALRCFSSCGCPDSERFQKVFNDACRRIEHDAGECLPLIADGTAQNRPAILFGLSRDSDQILIGQIAGEQGYKKVYAGTHHYQASTLRHTLHGGEAGIADFLPALQSAGSDWSRALAQHVTRLIVSRGLERQREITLPVRMPEHSPGYLVSWAYRRD